MQMDFIDLTDQELEVIDGGGWVKCGLGTAGGALTGSVAGAAAGTVTLPIVGTVAGSTVGFWGGGATGAATFC